MTFVFVLIALLPGRAFAGDGINGTWKGTYSYDDGRPPVSFELCLCSEGAGVIGTVSEPNTFGDKNAEALHARVEGNLVGHALTFRKTYDGTGGVQHSVEYTGAVSGETLTGIWRIPPETSGKFEVTRTAEAEKETGCPQQPVMSIRAL